VYKLTDDPNIIIDVENRRTIPKGHRWWTNYEEWLAAGNTPEPQYTREELKQIKISGIKQAFFNAGNAGLTTSLGLKVDANRVDKDNFQEVLNDCLDDNLPGATIRLWDNSFADVSVDDLRTIIREIRKNGLALYQRKWMKETAIKKATTEAQIKAITWDSVE